jgi:hypothetical protein
MTYTVDQDSIAKLYMNAKQKYPEKCDGLHESVLMGRAGMSRDDFELDFEQIPCKTEVIEILQGVIDKDNGLDCVTKKDVD